MVDYKTKYDFEQKIKIAEYEKRNLLKEIRMPLTLSNSRYYIIGFNPYSDFAITVKLCKQGLEYDGLIFTEKEFNELIRVLPDVIDNKRDEVEVSKYFITTLANNRTLAGLDSLLSYGMRGFNDEDRVGIVFTNAEFPDKPLAISLRKKSQINASVILDIMGMVLQSNSSFFTNNQLTAAIDRIELPTGMGRISLKEATKIDPFQEATTIASVCNKVFRRNFLEPNTIGIIPTDGYRMKDKSSQIALKWLCWQESLFPGLKHGGNSQEVRLKENLLVDGFCAITNTVFEFDGCYYHGCEKCYPQQTSSFRDSTNKNEQMFFRRDKTQAKHKRILDAGYNLKSIWECEFRKLLKTDEDVIACVNNNYKKYSQQPLNPRDSFFGGRTNAVKLHHKISNIGDEKIHYYDMCSLYPFINKYKKYPIGHPKIHIGNEECKKLSMDTVDGIIKCSILPPRNLYHPVLPYKCNNKLMFPLCKACVESMYQGQCIHTEEERKFTGTFVADELRKAVSLNYKILEIYEVWEYKVSQFNRKTKCGGLFSKYVDTFLKIKQECSGWPAWCTTETLKDEYIQAYFKHEGILLDKSKICNNPGMRFIAKLMLNSFWGKFGQRENLMQTSIITDPLELFKFLTTPSIVVNNMVVISDEVLLLCWNKPEEAVLPLTTVNVAVAAYTTAMARLELYSYLEKLDRRVLYFDTDSIIFTHKEGDWLPPVGDYLGMLTDEITEYGPGSKITEFVSGGPKNYAYRVYIANKKEYKSICKVKGITLNSKNSANVNFETLKAMVCDNAEPTYVHNNRKICIKPNYDVISRPEPKIYRIGYNKRRRLDNSYDTVPYGYQEEIGYTAATNGNKEADQELDDLLFTYLKELTSNPIDDGIKEVNNNFFK
ncbi:unnamed protein product [Brassicogethes aeneus]|uniref:DNA-directed DNA polymerase n=1 Tax=Brassicogethes aeneus TaxID=1431903 RepID=A0A9P0AZU7_BRAAE|nr:unnamed protein product [Brassicogethes aeneus]